MNRVEQLFDQKKIALNQLEVPEDLEMKMRNALRDRPLLRKRNNWNWKMKLVAACIIALLLVTQSDTLANYGKQLIGYDHVMNGTLQELNKLGKGQKIGKSYQFKNGATLTLDGVMLDENQLIAFYTVKGRKGDLEKVSVYGIGGTKKDYRQKSGTGQINPEETEMKYMLSFEPPNPREKELRLQFEWLDTAVADPEKGEIAFELDRKQAMGHVLKKEIHQSVNIGNRKIRFESILASPTTTVIKGVIQYPWELALDQLTGERIRPIDVKLRLLANGESIPAKGMGMSTNVDGIRFNHEFDALPSHLKQLQIQMTGFIADHDIEKKVPIQKDTRGHAVKILGQNLVIDKLEKTTGDTYLTISSDETLVLSSVQMIMDGKHYRLEETKSDVYQKKPDGTVIHTRTLHFRGSGQKLELFIDRMTYQTPCDKTINIPVY